MKMILGFIFSSMLASLAFAQAPATNQAQADNPMSEMTEHPPVPGAGTMVNPKDPKKDETSGAIVRKHDTPVSLNPAKKAKAKKIEKKKQPQTTMPKAEPKTDSTESTD